jgi:DNA-binding transcriptional LysR family regulator
MDINFELYKVFYLVAKLGSFSEAAEQLYISQSAVSQAIKKLETKLGGELFFRKKGGLKLTPEGKLLLTHIEQAYNFIKIAENKIFEIHNLDSGEIRIGASDTVCKYYLPSFLKQYNRLYPQVKIRIVNRTSPQIHEILRNGAIDVGIVTLPLKDPNLMVTELVSVEDIFVASDKFGELKNKKIRLESLTGYPLLLLEKTSATRLNFDNFLKERGMNVVPEIELESVDLLVEFARIGFGIAYVLRESASKEIQNQELFEIEVDEKFPVRKLGIITNRNVALSMAAQKFMELLLSKS